tara:strand:- start:1164 stop:1655 length:492 start_codon:yes stop_codon:yes gene_type:complete
MKSLIVLLFTITFSTFVKADINGDWKIKSSNFKNHPFEQDTITLLKIDSLAQKNLKNINLLSIFNNGESFYKPNYNQKQDSSTFIIGVFSGYKPDTLNKQFNNLLVISQQDSIQFIFFNNNENSTILKMSEKETIKHIQQDGNCKIYTFHFILKESKKIIIVK